MSNYNLYLTLSQKEKELLKNETKKKNLSLTSFVYSVLEPLYTSIYLYLHNLKGLNALDSNTIDRFISELEKGTGH